MKHFRRLWAWVTDARYCRRCDTFTETHLTQCDRCFTQDFMAWSRALQARDVTPHDLLMRIRAN